MKQGVLSIIAATYVAAIACMPIAPTQKLTPVPFEQTNQSYPVQDAGQLTIEQYILDLANRPENQVPVKDVFGKTTNTTLADLIRDSSIIRYDPPENVDFGCLGHTLEDFKSKNPAEIGIYALVTDKGLTGVFYFPKKVGVGYAGLGQEIKKEVEVCFR